MNPHDKRRSILQQIRNTLERFAEQNDTISISNLIGEICKDYEVSFRVAKSYIDELVIMGTAKRKDDMLWHNEELQLHAKYLNKIETEVNELNKQIPAKNQKEVIQ